MSVKVYCEDCERKVKPEPVPVSTPLYLLITVISFGIGVIFWAIAIWTANGRYQCPLCEDDLTQLYNAAIEQEEGKRKEERERFQEEYGLSWKRRVPVFLFYSAIIYGLITLDIPDNSIAWYVYLPFVLAALTSITGGSLFGERDLLDEPSVGKLILPLIFITLFMLGGMIAEAIFVALY